MEHLLAEALGVGRAILARRAGMQTSNEQAGLSEIGTAAVEAALITDPLQSPYRPALLAVPDPFAEDVELLGTTLLSLLERDLEPEVEAEVRKFFTTPGKLLSQPDNAERGEMDTPRGNWALICLNVARYCQPAARSELSVRIALVCDTLFAALDCLDDVEDQDDTPLRRELGDARTCNLSTVLIALSHHWLLERGVAGLSDTRIYNLLTLLHRLLLRAAYGQHMDILMEAIDNVTPEAALSMMHTRAGALGELICQFPALAVRARRITEDFGRFGEYMSMARQMQDDIYDFTAGIAAPLTAMKSDVRREKKTLPAVLTAHQLIYLQTSMHAHSNEERTDELRRRAIDDAVRATWGMAYYFRRQALLVAQQIEVKRAMPFPATLQFLCGLDDVA
jgi:geranylgeranyl pyrophosphate synthase